MGCAFRAAAVTLSIAFSAVFAAQGTISSIKDDAVRDGTLSPITVETVTEGRLGGGEETVYSPEDGPPLHHSAPTPRS